jgi:Polysaccharide biosynthesis enzyme WcbI
MRKLCLIYSNCQGDGLVHFLKRAGLEREYDFVVWHNWQLMLGEQRPDDMLVSVQQLRQRGGVAIFQPTNSFDCEKLGMSVPGTVELFPKDGYAGVEEISFPYNYNHGFFPFVKMGPGWDGWIGSEQVKEFAKHATSREARDNLIKAYFGDRLHYDCARRFIECLAEQSRRERECDIQMVPWILDNYWQHRLFLTYNHPTSVLFAEMARLVIEKLDLGWHWFSYLPGIDENEAGMNGVQPLHPAVVRELGLDYPATDHAIEYFHGILSCMINDLSTLR